MTTETTVWRAQLARNNEDMVRAENALRGERVVCIVRVAMLSLMALSQGPIRAVFETALPVDPTRIVITVCYVLHTGITWRIMSRTTATPRGATVGPFFISVVDAAFPFLMAWRTHLYAHNTDIAFAACTGGILICFSLARQRLAHVVWSTFLSCVMFLSTAFLIDEARPVLVSFVVGIYTALGILVASTNLATHNMFISIRKRDNLSRLLPKQVVERVLQMDGALRPAIKPVTVLFSDIRNFTSMSENLGPKDVLEFLDEYFGHMGQIVKAHDGMVNKFLGDGMLAVWGAPNSLPDHAEHAVRAAIDMRRKLEELNGHWVTEGRKPIAIGIGIHTGEVAAGMLGGADQHEYTVIGDAVNVAARVEGLTKGQGVDILITEDTFNALPGKYRCDRLAEERVKGREKPVVIYAVRERVIAPPVNA